MSTPTRIESLLLLELGILHGEVSAYLAGDNTKEDLIDAVMESQDRLERILRDIYREVRE